MQGLTVSLKNPGLSSVAVDALIALLQSNKAHCQEEDEFAEAAPYCSECAASHTHAHFAPGKSILDPIHHPVWRVRSTLQSFSGVPNLTVPLQINPMHSVAVIPVGLLLCFEGAPPKRCTFPKCIVALYQVLQLVCQ